MFPRIPPFLRFLKRFFRNRTSPPLVANPYSAGGLQEVDGHLIRKNRRVTFIELFYDLFLVAALNLFTRESNLTNGANISSYIVYFAVLWSIWVGQAFYDVRFGASDGTSWIYGFVQLLTYAFLSAVAGSFNITYRMFDHVDPNANAPQIVQRVSGGEATDAEILRSLECASGIYAASRLVLLIQYTPMLRFARSANRSLKPILYTQLGIAFNMLCAVIALGIYFRDTPASSIAALTIWLLGIVVESLANLVSAASSQTIYWDLENYWCERFAALTLIVVGEGVIGLFEEFRSFLSGVTVGYGAGDIAGSAFSAVGIFRIIYYLYFSYHSHHLKGGPVAHLVWGYIHFPLHLSLLLLTQCIAKAIAAGNVLFGLARYVTIAEALYTTVQPLSGSNTVSEWLSAVSTGDTAEAMNDFTEALGVNYTSIVNSYAELSQNSTNTFARLWGASLYSILARIFSLYGFDPSTESYNYIDAQLAVRDDPNYYEAFLQDTDDLIQPVMKSCMYAFTVAGSFCVCLCALGAMQKNMNDRYHKIAYIWRGIVGVSCLALTCLDIGPNASVQYLQGFTNDIAPIYALIINVFLVPALFLVLQVTSMLDIVLHLHRAYIRDGQATSEKQGDHLEKNSQHDTRNAGRSSASLADSSADTDELSIADTNADEH